MTDLAETPPDPKYPDHQAELPSGNDLVLEKVSFGYSPEQPLLREVTWRCAPGDHIALVGPSGGGKTTLVRLLTRLEDPVGGRILLGGADLRSWTEELLRTRIACATQDPWIFTSTVGENLRLAGPADDGELWRILDLIGLGDQVRAWPEGLETGVEEGGQSLSGGQRRRLALARVLLRKAPVTLLDEPTEGLESGAALALVRAIRHELDGRTLLWVTHRSQGLEDFPQVWAMENGRLYRRESSRESLAR
jgi:ATP-binding cassette subfamily C protein CydC